MPTSETTTNLFDVLAHLLMTTRLSLENPREGGELPRYVRIARINSDDTTPQGAVSFLEKITETGTEGLVLTISKMIELALQARKLFGETDSVKALVEVVLQLFKEGSKLSVTPDAAKLFNLSADSNNRVFPKYVENTLTEIEKYIDFIPAPEDLDRIGHELYRMACIVYKKDRTIDLNLTGKVRLLQWSFDVEWGVDDPSYKFKDIGKRNIELEPFSRELIYDKVRIMNVYTETVDVTEVKVRLGQLGYGDNDIKKNYKEFQYFNGLTVTGKLDVYTINRLLNLDFISKNLKRAISKPANTDVIIQNESGGYLDIVNGDADSFEDEGIKLNTTTGKMPFYQLGSEYNKSSSAAWVVDPGVVLPKPKNGLMHGFVGLRSRAYIGDDLFDGGTFSEGEAASGNFFFGARIIAPWLPGRSGPPSTLPAEPKVLYEADNTVYIGYISRMYQDINIDLSNQGSEFLRNIPSDCSLVLYASCMRRSCYNDKAQGTPDQGRILINIIDNENGQPLKDTFTEEWLPSGAITAALLKEKGMKDIKNVWFLQKSNPITITRNTENVFSFSENKKPFAPLQGPPSIKVRVILEGKLMSGWDIDAYFDDVRVRWDYVKKPVA